MSPPREAWVKPRSAIRSVFVHPPPRTIRSMFNQGATMKRLFTAKPLLAAAVALGAIGAASAAHAGTDVVLRVGFAQPGYAAPAYVVPAPAYYNTQVRYVDRSGPWGDRDLDGVPNVYDRD